MTVRVACLGECMLELSGSDHQSMTLSYGGDTLNTAVYLARLGIEVDYITALGDDPYSDWMLRQWEEEGVGTSHVVRLPGRLPGLYAIRTNPLGERQFHYWREQAPARDLIDLPESAQLGTKLADYDCLYLSGITLSLYDVRARDRLTELLNRARHQGCTIAFDSNYRPRGWSHANRAKTVMTETLRCCDIALPTFEDDHIVFGDIDATDSAKRLHALGVGEVAVKRDADGCLVSTIDGQEWVATVRRESPVDTTGAGDAFNAGYLAARLNNIAPIAAAARAHRLAGEVIMHPGAIIPIDAMPLEPNAKAET